MRGPTDYLDAMASESGPLRAVHLSRHKWPGGLVNQDSGRLPPAYINSIHGLYINIYLYISIYIVRSVYIVYIYTIYSIYIVYTDYTSINARAFRCAEKGPTILS